MKHVAFVAPYFLDATERFLAAAAADPAIRLGLVSCDPVSKLNPRIRQRLAADVAVPSTATRDLLHGVQTIQQRLGGSIDVLLGLLEQIQVPLGEIRDLLRIEGMDAATARNFRDKSRMKDVLRAHGLPCARHQLASTAAEGAAFAQLVGFPIVVKPPDGAGAKATYRCENAESLADCLRQLAPTAAHPVLLEEFITGQEHSFDSVSLNGRVVWSSISHYFPGPLEVVREPWIQWCVVIPRETGADPYRAIEGAAPAALAALGLRTGLSHLEWFRRPDGSVAISEVGARPPGAQFTSLLSYAHDRDFYRAWIELMIHGRFDPPPRRYACGAAYLRPMGRGRIRHVRGLEELGRDLAPLIVEAKIPQHGQISSGTYEGDGYIIVRHPETRAVEAALERIINTVRVDVDPLS